MNRYSSSGFIIMFGNVPFFWKSQKQKCIALSSMESEFIALTDSIKELIWFHRILTELNLMEINKPIQNCDNQSAIFFSRNKQENVRTKHIDIKYQFIRSLILDNVVELKYVKSKHNVADFLTKPLCKETLIKFVNIVFKF